MSFAATKFTHTSATRIPVLTPMYGARHQSFRAQLEGKFACGSSATSEFTLTFPGAEAAHCYFVHEAGTFSVNRLEGRVWVNDLPVTGLSRLNEGDVVSFGTVSFRLEYLESPLISRQFVADSSPSYRFPMSADPRATVEANGNSTTNNTVPSIVQDSSVQAALQIELLEHQRLLAMRQQQLDEFAHLIRERERHAESRLSVIEERSSQLSAQTAELASLRENLAVREQDFVLRTDEMKQLQQQLVDQQREAVAVAERNSVSQASIEDARAELSRQEAELLELQEQTLARQAEQANQNAELQRQSDELDQQRQLLAEQQRGADAVAEQNARSLAEIENTRAALSQQEAALQELRQQTQTAQDDLNSQRLLLEQQREETDRQRQLLTAQQHEVAAAAEQNALSLAEIEKNQAELSLQEAELREMREQTQTAQDDLNSQKLALEQQREETDRHRQLLDEQQQVAAAAAEQNALSFGEIENARSELSRQDAELRELREQYQTAQDELTTRESGFQKLCDDSILREELLSQREQALQEKTEYLEQQEADLADRAQLVAVAERESAARDSEMRETLSVEQLAAIAAEKELALNAQQAATAAQDELRQLQTAIEHRQAELREWQSEIESRADEVSHRLGLLKLYRSELRSTRADNESQTLASTDSMDQQMAAILVEKENLEQRAAEIVAAEERLSERESAAAAITQVADSERTALQNANKDLLCERNALAQLRQDLASRETGIADREVLVARQLEDLRTRFAVLDLRAAEQKQHESEIDSRAADVHRRIQQHKKDLLVLKEPVGHEQPAHGESASTTNETAAELLAVRQQVETLQEDLIDANDDRRAMVAEREELLGAVRELQKALQDARQDVEDANRLKHESKLLEQRLEQASQDRDERCRSMQDSESELLHLNEQLESLRAELAESKQERDELLAKAEELSLISNSVEPTVDARIGSGASFDTLSRELDQRAELLDRRDDELCERARKLEHSENEVETQRRQLLEARQQLEQARAEIQVAMRQQSEHGRPAEPSKPTREDYSSDSDQNESNPFGSHDAGRSIELESPKPNTSANGPATDLRSELAGLFGLQKTIQSSPQSEDLDLSEPTGENMSVMFNFGTDAQTLVEAESERLLQEGAQPAREENSDDFVCQYMEELLTRSRQTAGSVLPGELKAAEKKSEPAAASAAKSVEPPVKKSGPKVKSFIEQYMAGNMGDLDNPKSLEVSDSGSESCGTAADTESRPVLPRQKMDLQKLKENMASFRTLSTQSVENALASHALRVERHGFTGRTGFAIVLLTMTLVLGIANAKGVIDYPMLTWVTLTSAIGILNELHRRYASIKIHTRSPLDLLFSSDPPRESADMMAAAPIPAVECSSRNDDSTIDDDCVEPVEESNPSETALVETHVS